MFDRLIATAIARRWLVMLAALAMAGIGVYNYGRLPIDAVPDVTNVQVQINTAAPGYSPLETEQRITYPVEAVLSGLPHLEQFRSLSRYGLSQVTVVFEEGTDIQFARQLVSQRLQDAREGLPAGVIPTLGPIATGLSEIYQWTVETEPGAKKPDGTPYTPTDLREIQDWIIKPQLRTVPGVTEINSIGGFDKEYLVAPNTATLSSYGLELADIVNALERNNSNVGAGYIEREGEQYLVRAPGQAASIDDIGNIVVTSIRGIPVRVRDVAEVTIGQELRTGAATENGVEVVLGTVVMLIGENSRAVSKAVDARMLEINRSLPKGVKAVTVYDRTVLVERAIATVRKNLVEGAILVVAVLFFFLGNLRAALLTAMVIPLSMLFTFSGMVANGVSANLLSLGALDFGIIVDGAVVIVENCVRRLAAAQHRLGRILTREERFAEVFEAAREARRPLIYGQLIIMIVYLPIFALTGIEGKMFHPMAFTVVFALLGAMILSVTFVPAAVALFIGRSITEKESRVMGAARRWYAPALDYALANRAVMLVFAAVVIALAALMGTRLGTEFAPNLDEGDMAVLTMRVPGTSLTQSVKMQQQIETVLKSEFPEIARVFARIGTAEIASDPMPPNVADSYIIFKPEKEWPKPRRTRAQVESAIRTTLEGLPGNSYEFSQPIQLRVNELISGVRSDVAVKLFGDDLGVLETSANEIAATLRRVPGASEVQVEQTSGLPMLQIRVDRERAARMGLNIGDVQEMIATATAGRAAGTLFEGDRRFDIVVRLPEAVRGDIDALRRLPVALPGSAEGTRSFIALGEIASFEVAPGPNQLSREQGKRRVVVSANVRGRDIGSFVAQAQERIEQEVRIAPGYWIAWGGQFEHLAKAAERLQLIVPASLLLVFVLLYLVFNNVRDGLLVFTGIPFALAGGVAALWARGIPLSISAAVGFIALSGVAVLNGLVLISFIRSLREQGVALVEAVRQGALARLRPVLMTALVASLGFVPMALAVGTGAEVQRPLATVVIGGVLSSTVLTLLLLPVLYEWTHRERPARDFLASVRPFFRRDSKNIP
ncbi:CusA/CzcA family heavy metal efflux RND transporter [Massilia sp. CFBP9012]|uniref:efflux RND transporter permease subunit n=1 Tax=Massilia sp. CFBP9012 TaxID=3096531 RepID=UPI002A6B7882|nr:CusA/CzcA family heavy metal efflux RND transporter [Massilia sp. CFBP9012]MDY0977356.1 CusA/CzcA family heavy metal efflux RND transporter [Massilia sp. CFBP9012]